jgi:hypothetical protein
VTHRHELRQRLFIGLMHFFSIMLPGALLTWLLREEVRPVVLGDRYANSLARRVAFEVTSQTCQNKHPPASKVTERQMTGFNRLSRSLGSYSPEALACPRPNLYTAGVVTDSIPCRR